MYDQYIVIVFDTSDSPTECMIYSIVANDINDVIDELKQTGEVPAHIDLDNEDNVLICGVHETQALCGSFSISWLIS